MSMKFEDFADDLPSDVKCDRCRRLLPATDWRVARFGRSDWSGLCLTRCECGLVMVAAAGSSSEAHFSAQIARWKLLAAVNGKTV